MLLSRTKHLIYRKNKLILNTLTIRNFSSISPHEKLINEYETQLKLSRERNPKDINRHVEMNKKLLLNDRLQFLIDPGSFLLELSPLAGLDLPYGSIPSAGSFSGIACISGTRCLILASDATVKGGTSYPITVKKQLRALNISLQNNIPCLHIIDSGGAFLPLQAEIFPDANHGGRIFCNQAIISARGIPQVSLVCGSCTAGAAYIPTMSDEAVIVEGIGTIFLAGPALVKSATGEETTPDELGGARLHSEISGCTDYFCKTEFEALTLVKSLVSQFNLDENRFMLTKSEKSLPPLTNINEVYADYINSEMREEFPMRAIVESIIDNSKFVEFKARYGVGILTCFAKIGGYPCGIIANTGQLLGDESIKAAHFVQICNQRDIPLLFLVNIPDNISNSENSLKYQATFMQATLQATMPKITIVIGECTYPQAYTMCSRSMDPNFLFTWPNVTFKFSTGEDGITQNAFYSTARLWDDGIILPSQTREILQNVLLYCQMYEPKFEYLNKNYDKSKFLRM